MDRDVIETIRSMQAELSLAEGQVAATVLADPQFTIAATVAELASRAQVSQASVVRFSRALGFDGVPSFRLELAQELSRRALELERSDIAEGEINASDTVAEVVSKIAFHEARSIEQTARLLDLDALDRVAGAIAVAHHTSVYGVGASGLAGADLAQKLQRIGLMCLSSQDTHVQLVNAALAGPGSVAIAFSFSGRTVEVHQALSIAKRGGALTVAVTNDRDSPIGKVADHVLMTSAREAQLRAAALASRMAQLAVVDFLFVRIAQLRFDDVESALEATRAAVTSQRLHPGGS
jgi:DNA-binding MurR/RpiR family transcriptional regulator